MAGINKEIIVGNVGGIDGLKEAKSGTKYIKFSVAVNTGYGDKKTTEWFNCTAFGKTAEFIGEFVSKGDLVYVEGKRQTTKDKDGKYWTNTTVDVLQLLSGSPRENDSRSDNEPF